MGHGVENCFRMDPQALFMMHPLFLVQEKQVFTLKGRYEVFRNQSRALLLGKLSTAVFCQ